MLNIKRWNGKIGLPMLLLTVLVAMPAQIDAQQSAQDGNKRSKRPPLRVRVVTDSRVGVPVVVAGEAPAGSAAGAASANPNVQVRIEDGAAAQSAESEIENWLVGGPSTSESWLTQTVSAPAPQPEAAPVANPTEARAQQLTGVQHYMESTQPSGSSSIRRPPAPAGVQHYTESTQASASSSARILPAPTAVPASAPAIGTYRLGAGDGIEVHVWRNPDLSRSVPVRPDGMISLPLAGELLASGKTVAQLGDEITVALGEFIQQPTVTVTVTAVRSFVIYVTGQVSGAGPLTLDRPVNVVQALSMAGGVLEFADRNGVVVIRTVNGRPVRIPFRYGDALKGKGEIAELILQSGDVIYVP